MARGDDPSQEYWEEWRLRGEQRSRRRHALDTSQENVEVLCYDFSRTKLPTTLLVSYTTVFLVTPPKQGKLSFSRKQEGGTSDLPKESTVEIYLRRSDPSLCGQLRDLY
jgi:hypothetical protein